MFVKILFLGNGYEIFFFKKGYPFKKLVSSVLSAILLITVILSMPFLSLPEENSEEGSGAVAKWGQGSFVQKPSGSGTSASPYLITNAKELGFLSGGGSDKYYKLMANIDLSGAYWQPADLSSSGNFDGGGFTISNLTINTDYFDAQEVAIGFFGFSSGIIQNIKFKNASVTVNSANELLGVGIVAGIMSGTISKIYVQGTVNISNPANFHYAGGIVGAATGSISQCMVEESDIINGTYDSAYAGGIVGNSNGSISNCLVKNTSVSCVLSPHSTTSTSYAFNWVEHDNPAIGYDTVYYKGRKIITTKYTTNVYAGGIAGISNTISNCYVKNVNVTAELSGSIIFTYETPKVGVKTNVSISGTTLANRMNRILGHSGSFSNSDFNNYKNKWHTNSQDDVQILADYLGEYSLYTTNDTRVQLSYSIAYSGSFTNCQTSAPRALGNFPGSVWAVSPYIYGGDLHLKWMYWQDI